MIILLSFHDEGLDLPVTLNLANVVHATGDKSVQLMMEDGNAFNAPVTMAEFKRQLEILSLKKGSAAVAILEL